MGPQSADADCGPTEAADLFTFHNALEKTPPMWFKNLTLYKINPGVELDAQSLNEFISLQTFVPCMSTEMESFGWVPPRKDSDLLVWGRGKDLFLTLRHEKKLLPGSVITQVAKARAAAIMENEGRTPGRKEMKEIKEDVKQELLAKAFVVQSEIRAWLDLEGGWLVVDSASASKAAAVHDLLRKALVDMSSQLFMTQMSPGQCMTNWLLEGEGPSGFTVDMDAELVAPDTKATLKYARETPSTDDVTKHVKAGKQVTKLAMTFDSKVSFMLTDKGEIRKVKALDILQEQAAASGADTAEDIFEADMMLMSGELRQLIDAMVESLGGLQLDNGAPAPETKEETAETA